MVNNSHSPIPQVKEKKKHYTTRDIKRYDNVRRFQHITGRPVKWILHAVENNILQIFPILQENFEMSEDICGPSVPHL